MRVSVLILRYGRCSSQICCGKDFRGCILWLDLKRRKHDNLLFLSSNIQQNVFHLGICEHVVAI
jgi:hypothetical protein